MFGELPLLPHLPELPARGLGADLIGRGATLLSDMAVEVQPSGWRLTAHAGRDLRRARDLLAWDLDALEQQAAGLSGPVKISVAGPWTLAVGLELPSGHRVVSDHGATRDLGQALAEGLRALLADLGRRLPSATIVVQLDEPSLPAVLAARVPTPSGYGTVRSVEASTVRQVLGAVVDVVPAGNRVVHCCAADVPIGLLREAGADALSVDLSLLPISGRDALGEAVEAGVSLWLGVVPGTDSSITVASIRDPIRRVWNELGFPASQLAAAVVPTPTCGLAGASPAYARRVLSLLREAGRSLLEDPDLERPAGETVTPPR